MGRIEVVESFLKKDIHHLLNLGYVDVFADHRKPHATETQTFFHFIESLHILFLLFSKTFYHHLIFSLGFFP